MAGDRAGFSLLELLVTVLIIGLLAAIALPQYHKLVERGRAAEALSCVTTIKNAQERYHLKNGAYAATKALLDLDCLLNYYTLVPNMGGGSGFVVEVQRQAPLPPIYGAYSFLYTVPPAALTCTGSSCSDLLP